MNEHMREIARVASKQGCIVSAVTWTGPFKALVYLVDRGNLSSPYRITTHRQGDDEFGPGYYCGNVERANLEWREQVERRGLWAVAEVSGEDAEVKRGLADEGINLVAELHSAIYNPEDHQPAEPMLARLERVLRALR